MYADDVMVFVKPNERYLQVCVALLHIFGEASGLKVNYNKSVAIMIRVEDEDAQLLKEALRWKMETFPCRYMGLQLSIKQLKRLEWQLVVDAALRIVPG